MCGDVSVVLRKSFQIVTMKPSYLGDPFCVNPCLVDPTDSILILATPHDLLLEKVNSSLLDLPGVSRFVLLTEKELRNKPH